MTVERAVAAADHVGPEAVQHALDACAVEDLGRVGDDAGLVVQALERLRACLQLRLREGEMEPARTLEGDVQPGLDLQARREAGPGIGRTDGPAGVLRQAQPLALHPHQREVGARGARRGVAFVQHHDALAEPREAERHRRADQPAADDGNVVVPVHRGRHQASSRPRPTSSRSRP